MVAVVVAGSLAPGLGAGRAVEWVRDQSRMVATAHELKLLSRAMAESSGVTALRPPDRNSLAFQLCGGSKRQDCIVDGDTIWHGGVKIRLADIDTPEVSNPQCAAEAELGRRATERLRELVNAGPFQLMRSAREIDRYGRQLRILERDGRSLGQILIAEGLARPWGGARRSWCG